MQARAGFGFGSGSRPLIASSDQPLNHLACPQGWGLGLARGPCSSLQPETLQRLLKMEAGKRLGRPGTLEGPDLETPKTRVLARPWRFWEAGRP